MGISRRTQLASSTSFAIDIMSAIRHVTVAVSGITPSILGALRISESYACYKETDLRGYIKCHGRLKRPSDEWG